MVHVRGRFLSTRAAPARPADGGAKAFCRRGVTADRARHPAARAAIGSRKNIPRRSAAVLVRFYRCVARWPKILNRGSRLAPFRAAVYIIDRTLQAQRLRPVRSSADWVTTARHDFPKR
jgi:hypothetical protein